MQLNGGESQKNPSLNNQISNLIAEKSSLTKIAFESHDVEIFKCISIPTNLICSKILWNFWTRSGFLYAQSMLVTGAILLYRLRFITRLCIPAIRVLVKPNTCVQYFHDHNSTHQLCYKCNIHISINDATPRTQQTIMICFHKNEACAKLTHLGSIHPLLPLVLNEISGTFLPGQVGGVHLTFRIRVSLSTFVWLIFLMTSRCNPSLSSLLIDGRFTCTPVGGGAIFRSLLRKSSHRLHKCTQRKSIKELHINHISSLDAQKPLFPHRKVCNATRWDKELSL